MKKLRFGLVLAVALVAFAINPAFAAVEVTVFEGICARGKGKPVTETFIFPGIGGPATITLWNGGAGDSTNGRVSSSEVRVNGVLIFGPNNFNQRVSSLQAEVLLEEGDNFLEVLLRSEPGGKVAIEVVQLIDAEAAAVIGPEGGAVEVLEDTSPLFGIKLFFPPHSVEKPELISITASELPNIIFPDSYEHIIVSQPFRILPDISLIKDVTLQIPYPNIENISNEDSNIISVRDLQVLRLDASGDYIEIVPSSIDPINNLLTLTTKNFSLWWIHLGRWKKNSQIKYYIDTLPTNVKYNNIDFVQDLQEAFDAWEDELNKVNISFERVYYAYQADIQIISEDHCESSNPRISDDRDDACTMTDALELWQIHPRLRYQRNIYFNTGDFSTTKSRFWVANDYADWANKLNELPVHPLWPERGYEPIPFKIIAMHEIGHALGLKHDGEAFGIDISGTVMHSYFFPNSLIENPLLHPRDVYQLRAKYGIEIIDDDDACDTSVIVVPTRTITVDGYADDWEGIAPTIIDAQGGSICEPGTDIKALFLAKDNQFLYWRVDTWDDTFYFGTPDKQRILVLLFYETTYIPGFYPNGLTVNIDGPNNGFLSARYTNDEWTGLYGGPEYGTVRQVAEGRIPLEEFDRFSIDHVSAYYWGDLETDLQCNDAWVIGELELN